MSGKGLLSNLSLISFLEFNRDLENKTPYERFEVCH